MPKKKMVDELSIEKATERIESRIETIYATALEEM